MVRATPRRPRGARLAMLEIRSLSKSFGGVKATDNVTLDVADGSLTAVIGPNGAGKRNRTAATLSHGDQKLLDIALALVLDPKVLLLDEPTAGMGTEERWRMIDKVRELWETQKITVVFIEHDMDIVFKIAPEIVVLCYGRILATGTPDAIRRNEAVIEAYLGTEHHAGAAI